MHKDAADAAAKQRAILTRKSLLGGRSGNQTRAACRARPGSNPAAVPGAMGRGHSRVGPHQAARRLPDRHDAVHRDGAGQPADHRQRHAAEPAARRGARARQPCAAGRACAGAADALHRSGAAVAGRGRHLEDPAREQPVQRQRWPRWSPPARPTSRWSSRSASSQDEAMAVVADMANAIRDGKLGTVTGTLLRRQERLDSEITAQVGRLVVAAAGPDGAAARQRQRRQSPVADPHQRRSRSARCCSRCSADS